MNLPSAAAVLAIKVISSGVCPSSEQVHGHLQTYASTRETGGGAVVRIDEGGPDIHLTWLSADGATTFTKSVPASPDCGARARAAALVIASHQGEFPAISLTPAFVARAEPPPQEVLRPTRIYLAAGAGAASGNGGAMAGLLELGMAQPARMLAFSSRLRGAFPGDATVGAGEAVYFHLIPSVVVRQRMSFKRIAFDFHQELAAIVTRASGRNFDRNYNVTSLVPAVGGGTKLEYALGGRYGLWCDITWLMALGESRLMGTDTRGRDQATTLSRHQVWALVGIGSEF